MRSVVEGGAQRRCMLLQLAVFVPSTTACGGGPLPRTGEELEQKGEANASPFYCP